MGCHLGEELFRLVEPEPVEADLITAEEADGCLLLLLLLFVDEDVVVELVDVEELRF